VTGAAGGIGPELTRLLALVGYVAFDEIPGTPIVVGAGFIVAAGLIRFQHQDGRANSDSESRSRGSQRHDRTIAIADRIRGGCDAWEVHGSESRSGQAQQSYE
jgi:hypothetical protein